MVAWSELEQKYEHEPSSEMAAKYFIDKYGKRQTTDRQTMKSSANKKLIYRQD